MNKLIAVIFLFLSFHTYSQKQPELAIAIDMSNDSLMQAAGYKYYVESISKHFSPINVDDEAFKKKVAEVKALKTKIYAVNLFIPGTIKVVGPAADEAKTLEYTGKLFPRLKTVGINMIIWGSGGSRQRPEGTDVETATKQFTSIAQKVADQAKSFGITIALEDLNSTETNFLNSLQSCIDMVKAVNRSNFKLAPDIYHMLKDGDGPELLIQGAPYIVHIDIAEKEGRSSPGTHNEDFTPYFKALKQIGYKGKIVLECNWTNIKAEAFSGKKELKRQLDAVYK